MSADRLLSRDRGLAQSSLASAFGGQSGLHSQN